MILIWCLAIPNMSNMKYSTPRYDNGLVIMEMQMLMVHKIWFIHNYVNTKKYKKCKVLKQWQKQLAMWNKHHIGDLEFEQFTMKIPVQQKELIQYQNEKGSSTSQYAMICPLLLFENKFWNISSMTEYVCWDQCFLLISVATCSEW